MDFSSRAHVYQRYRKADLRLVQALCECMQIPKGAIIADIGAGTGNYSGEFVDLGYRVISVEPEPNMRKNSPRMDLHWVDSVAESIDLPDSSVDAVIAINSVHHFSDFVKAQREIYRVLKHGPMAIFTFDPEIAVKMWLFDYWPELRSVEERNYPPLTWIVEQITDVFGERPEVINFDLPQDFQDVFSAALWSRPQILFEEGAQSAMSLLNSMEEKTFRLGLKLLEKDLNDGTFWKKYPDLKACATNDVGCRILLARKD